jgi:hypothetical protein
MEMFRHPNNKPILSSSVVRITTFFNKSTRGDIKGIARQRSSKGGVERTWTFWKMVVFLVGE